MYFLKLALMIVFLTPTLAVGQSKSDLIKNGERALENEDYKDALNIYNSLIKNYGDSAYYYYRMSEAHLSLNEVDASFNDIQKAVDLDPDGFYPMYNRGVFYETIGMQEKSLEDYLVARKNTQIDSLWFKATLRLASVNRDIRNFTEAKKYYEELLEIDSTNPGILNDYSILLIDLGYGEEAISIMKKLVERDSTLPYAVMNIGFFYSELGEYEKSITYFDRTIKLDPDHGYAYNNRGFSKFKLKRYKEALEDINRSIKIDRHNAYAYRNRAKVYLKLGKSKKACKDLEQALEYNYTQQFGNDVQELHDRHCY